MEMTRERCQSAQEEKRQLTLKVEELERLEILGFSGSCNLPFPSSSCCFFRGLKQSQFLFLSPMCLQSSVHPLVPHGSYP